MDPSNEIIPDNKTFLKCEICGAFSPLFSFSSFFPPSFLPVLSHPPTNHVSIGQFSFSEVIKNGAIPELSLSPKNGT